MEPFLGQIALFAFNYAPKGWLQCQGQQLPISGQFAALYSLLGTSYGGNGRSNFNLPNLQGIVLYGASPNGSPYVGQTDGATTVTIDQSTMAVHNHNLVATTLAGTAATAANDLLAQTATVNKGGSTLVLRRYSTGSVTTALSSQSIGSTGSGQAHNNMQPYLVLNYCIALQGIYPQRP